MKLRSRKQLYLYIALIAAALTALILYFVPLPLQPYRVTIQEVKEPVIPNPNIVYHDFDHDGNSEMFALKYQIDLNQAAAKIYSADGGLIDQWTFGERWLNRAFAFGDYDSDGNDEAYIFTQKRDSVFLYAFKPAEKGFFIKRRFVDKIARRNQQSDWDVQAMTGIFIDSDGDGYRDFIFGLVAGLSLQPRRYYAFSPAKNEIIFKSPASYANFIGPQTVDVDGDGRPEILNRGSVATGNAGGKDGPFNDQRAYLLIFDKELRYKFPPKPFGDRGSQIQVEPAPSYMPGKLLIVHNHQGVRDKPSALLLLDETGRVRLKRKLATNKTWCLLSANRSNGERMFLYDQHGCFEELGSDLQTVKKYSFPQAGGGLRARCDLDGDFADEWIFSNGEHLTIVRSDFSDALSFPLKCGGLCQISIKKRNGRRPQLFVLMQNRRYLISYAKNPLYPLRFILYVLIFSVIFFLLYLIFWATNMVVSYSWALNYMIGNPQRGILLLDEKGRIVQMNQTLIKQMQPKTSYLKNEKYEEIFSHLPAVKDFITNTMHSAQKQSEEVLITSDNFSFRGRLFMRPIDGLLHYPSGFYFEASDYNQPVQDDRLKVWSKSVQKMAHDIKTPLSSISINLTMIKKKLSDKAPRALEHVGGDIEIMINEMERLREMTKNFLKFTNLEKPNLQTFSLGVFLQEVADDFKTYYSDTLDFILDIDYAQDVIRADRAQLKMALKALLENAIDAVKGSGIVGLSAMKIQKIDQGFDNFIEIEVFDNGGGIPREARGKIFEPYFTTKADGTGMGLAIAKKIIEDHGGTIELRSTEKFSTVFRIMFPIGNISA